MKTEDIKKLLQKFYAGESSAEEEKILASFLLHENLPDEFLTDRQVFAALHENSCPLPQNWEQKIELLIDSFEETKEVKQPQRAKLSPWKFWTVGIAASLAIAFGVQQLQENKQAETTLFTDTYSNTDEAYKATMDALQLFSQNFTVTTKSVEKANSHIEKVNEIINNTTK